MYKYLVILVLSTPLLGIWMVEKGAFAASVGREGYPNGAAAAYAGYAATAAGVAVVVARSRRRRAAAHEPSAADDARFRQFGTLLLIFSAAALGLFLFGFGAYEVWTGAIGKGEFRISFGVLGALPNLLYKTTLPMLLAYATVLYMRSSRAWRLRWLFGMNFFLVFMFGASWGFKASALWPILPSLVLLYWSVRLRELLRLGVLLAAAIVLFSFVFDARIEDVPAVVDYLVTRATVLQGDVSWHIWDLYRAGEEFPNYWPTLLAAPGDKFLTAIGVIDRSDPYEWMLYHYDWMLTYVAHDSLEGILAGHSVTGTPFSEGLIAGGEAGVLGFAVFAGFAVGLLFRLLARAIHRGQALWASIGASYFCNNLLPWLNGGAVLQLVHIAVFVGIGTTVVLVLLMRARYRI